MQQVCAGDETVRAAWRGAWDRLGALFEAPAFAVTFDMTAGDMVLMDNRRVLHGRTAFETSGEVVRHLQGGYADMDGVYSTLRRSTQAYVDRELDALEARFESDVLSQTYGEDISIRDHMLQSAEGAVARRMGANLVAAALLHDIGWGMPGPHEATAATMLKRLMGEGVASLIRHHVDAKRYLVAARPDYAARLSAASVATLKQQGGPMTPDDCRAFEALPDFELCLALRYLDEGGKAMSPPVSRFADYRPLLTALMIRHALAV
jgi:gamma-butyrobetaine dioxygenase